MREEIKDIDPQETQEWLDSIESIIKTNGIERAHFLIEKIISRVVISLSKLKVVIRNLFFLLF